MIIFEVQKTLNIFCVISIITTRTLCDAGKSIGGTRSQRPYSPPVLREVPKNVTSVDGILEFACLADGFPNPLIFWYNASTRQLLADQVPTSRSPLGIHTNPYRGKLMISGAVRNTVYRVYCNASNTEGWVVSQPSVSGRLAFIDSEFRSSPVNQSASQNGRLVLPCEPPEGTPEVGIHWLFNGKVVGNRTHLGNPTHLDNVLSHVSSNKWVTEAGHLVLDPVALSDSGAYVCVASNSAGKRKARPVFVMVNGGGAFLKTPRPTRVKENEDVKLWCQIDGDQQVNWSRGLGEGLIDPHRSLVTNQYILLKTVRPSDSGTYICSSPNGGIRHNATLIVDTPPKFVQIPRSLVATVGSTVAIKCSVTGQPTPSVYWELPDMTPIFPSKFLLNTENHSSYPQVDADGTIIIKNVQVTDSGVYQCTAHSSVDTIHASVRLTVKASGLHPEEIRLETSSKPTSPSVYTLPPIINLPPSNQTTTVGQTVDLSCQASGLSVSTADKLHPVTVNKNFTYLSIMSDKRLLIVWTKVGRTKNKHGKFMVNSVNPKKFKMLSDGSLRIADLKQDDTGQYVCTIFALVPQLIAEAGRFEIVLTQSSWSANLIVMDDPSVSRLWLMKTPTILPPPRHLRITNITDDTATLAWDLPDMAGGTGIVAPSLNARVSYWIEYFRQDRASEGWIVVNENWPRRIVHFHGLQSNIPYYFLIRSRWNDSFLGEASPPYGPVSVGQSKEWIALLNSSTQAARHVDIIETVNRVSLVLTNLVALSSTEVELTWSLSGDESMTRLIWGYEISYEEVVFSSCTGQQKMMRSKRKSTRSYCSVGDEVTNRKLFGLMTIAQTVKSITVNAAQNSIVLAEMTSAHNTSGFGNSSKTHYKTKYVLQNLQPFRCYALTVSPIPHKLSHRVLVDRVTTAQNMLTHEDLPTGAPRRIAAQWNNDNVFQLTWDYPPVQAWNGLLSGFIIYITSDAGGTQQQQQQEQHGQQKQQRRQQHTTTTTVNVSSTFLKTVVKVSSHRKAYRIQMAAVNCIGLGPLSLPVHLPPMRHITVSAGAPSHSPPTTMSLGDWHTQLLSTPGQNLTSPNRQLSGLKVSPSAYEFPHSLWLFGILIIVLISWFLVILLMTLFCYRRHRIQQTTKATAALMPITYYLKNGGNRKPDELKHSMCVSDAHEIDKFRDLNLINISPASNLIINHETPSNCIESSIYAKHNTETINSDMVHRSASHKRSTDLGSLEVQMNPSRTSNDPSLPLSETELLSTNLTVSDNYANSNSSRTTSLRTKIANGHTNNALAACNIPTSNGVLAAVQPARFIFQPITYPHPLITNNCNWVSSCCSVGEKYPRLISQSASHTTLPYVTTSIIDSRDFTNGLSQYPPIHKFTPEYSVLPTETIVEQSHLDPIFIRPIRKVEPDRIIHCGEEKKAEVDRMCGQNRPQKQAHLLQRSMQAQASLPPETTSHVDFSSPQTMPNILTPEDIRKLNFVHSEAAPFMSAGFNHH